MKRVVRILRIWYFGKLSLAKTIKRKVFWYRAEKYCKNYIAQDNAYFKAREFNNAMNEAQLEYYKSLFPKN